MIDKDSPTKKDAEENKTQKMNIDFDADYVELES